MDFVLVKLGRLAVQTASYTALTALLGGGTIFSYSSYSADISQSSHVYGHLHVGLHVRCLVPIPLCVP